MKRRVVNLDRERIKRLTPEEKRERARNVRDDRLRRHRQAYCEAEARLRKAVATEAATEICSQFVKAVFEELNPPDEVKIRIMTKLAALTAPSEDAP